MLPERTTPAALFAGGCSLWLFPSSLRATEESAATTAAAAAAMIDGGGGSNGADAFAAAPPLASSNVRRIQILSPVIIRYESLEAMKRRECSVVERPRKSTSKEEGAEEEEKKKTEKKQKKRSRKAKAAAAADEESGDLVLPSAGEIAAEAGKKVFEALRAL